MVLTTSRAAPASKSAPQRTPTKTGITKGQYLSRNGLDNLARRAGFQIGTPEGPNQDYEVRYGYDHVNRLSSVAAQGYLVNRGTEP